MIESLAMMREKVRVEQNEPFQGEEIRETQPIFDKTPDFGRHPSSNSSDSESDVSNGRLKGVCWCIKKGKRKGSERSA